MRVTVSSLRRGFRTFLEAYVSWDAHVEIAIAAALASVVTVVSGFRLSAVRIIALPIAGTLLVTAYFLTDPDSSFIGYLFGLHGLKQVTVASLPALFLVGITEQSIFDLLQTAYWVLGLIALTAIAVVVGRVRLTS